MCTAAPRPVALLALVAALAASGCAVDVDLADHIEAVFLGTGPSAQDDDRPDAGVWRGFARGASIRVVISDTVRAPVFENLEAALLDLEDAATGAWAIDVVYTSQANPIPEPGDVTIAQGAERVDEVCTNDDVNGCADLLRDGDEPTYAARTVIDDDVHRYVAAHEVVGHAILGWFHVTEASVGWGQGSVITGRKELGVGGLTLSDVDRAAIAAVLESDLDAGATWVDFQRAGLIRGAR